MSRYDVDPAILEETRCRYDALCGRIDALMTATAEQWKTLETAERTLLTMAGTPELDCRQQFPTSREPPPPPRPTETALAKQRGDQLETAQFYVTVGAPPSCSTRCSAVDEIRYRPIISTRWCQSRIVFLGSQFLPIQIWELVWNKPDFFGKSSKHKAAS